MVRLLGLNSRVGIDTAGGGGGSGGPREILKTPNSAGDSGWLIRFFDSNFFDEWIAISYLYKHEHAGVRDYLCNRMYTLPWSGVESYLYQLCFMVIHKPSAALDRYLIDMCSKSLRIAIKVHWFLQAESEDLIDSERIGNLLEKCQTAALNGDWAPLIKPSKYSNSPGPKRMLNKLLSSRLLSPPNQKQLPPPSSDIEETTIRESGNLKRSSEDSDFSKVFKKFVPPMPKVRDVLPKKFREKEDEDALKSKDTESDNFLRRLLFSQKDDEERSMRSSDDFSILFRRLLRSDGEEKIGEEEKDGFFRKLFPKSEERDRSDSRERGDDEEKATMSGEDDEGPDFSFLVRKFMRIHPQDDDKTGLPDSIVGTPPEKSSDSPGESFLKKFFKDKSSDDSKFFSYKREDGTGNSPSSFLKRFTFKDRTDDERTVRNSDDGNGPVHPSHGTGTGSVAAEGQTWEKIKDWQHPVRVAPIPCDLEEKDSVTSAVNGRYVDGLGESDVTARDRKSFDEKDDFQGRLESEEQGLRDAFAAAEKPSDLGAMKALQGPDLVSSPPRKSVSLTKRSGSPLKKQEKAFSKPPLPKQTAFKIRKGTYYATLDYVQSLCDTSTGLADVFPMEDRRISLRESLQELNAHLAAAEGDGGVCFVMGKGLCRAVHIPEEEAVLLNSREKAPFLISVEVLKCETWRPEIAKELKESLPRKRSGIPLASGDLHFPNAPPPWAFPTWNHPMQKPNTEELLRITSKAIDVALAQSLNSKLKVVDVSLTVDGADVKSDPSTPKTPSSEVDLASTPVGISTEVSQRLVMANGILGNSGRIMCTDEVGRVENGRNGNVHAGHIDKTDVKDSEGDLTKCLRSRDSHTQTRNGCTAGWVSVVLTSVAGLSMDDVETDPHPNGPKIHRRVPSTIAMAAVTAAAAKGEAPPGLPASKSGSAPAETEALAMNGKEVKATDALAGELWADKKERIRRSSKFGHLPDWDLCSMIVKSGDDCRQEHLAVQLIAEFYDIFQDAGVPLWLRPYEVLVTSSHTALIETIPDSLSIHAIKSRNPNLSSLRDFFCKKYVEESPEYRIAQRNFVESMAGYSLLCYILQVKDRHNGNLLLDEEGHIIHIDFGFMLSNSPGGVNFESAPFKLTRELLEVMDSDAEGFNSEFFEYYKILCIQGFLLCRKNAERIMLLVEMMQDSGCPCYKGGARTLQNLRKRFHLNLTEQQCVQLVLSLIDNSLDAWRSRQYDYYQRVLNGIL